MALSNLILTGGINHDFSGTAEALQWILNDAGFESRVFDDIDEGFKALAGNTFDLVTVFTLRWRMLDDDKYIPFRDEWAYEISQADRDNLLNHLAAGRGLLGLHTACICFDTWDQWGEVLGARWQWGRTWHPPPADIHISNINRHHPVTSNLDDFNVTDEIYHHLQPTDGAVALFSAESAQQHDLQTLAWAHEYLAGRVVFSSLGHDTASVTTPGHRQFLQQAAQWCAGSVSATDSHPI